MIDIVDRLRFDAVRCEVAYSKGVAGNIEEAANEIKRLREWKSSILGKCKASDGFDALPWGGDKDGWGFVHYFIGHLETRALHAETLLAEQDASPAATPATLTDEMIDAYLKSSDQWCAPHVAECESGVAIECDISQDDADWINTDSRDALRKTYEALAALVASPDSRPMQRVAE